MAESSPSPFSTPKRKRSDIGVDNVSAPSYAHFSFEVDGPSTPTAGNSSPRSGVAHRFRGLALNDSGGGHSGVVTANVQNPSFGPAAMDIDEDESRMRKRTRFSLSPSPATTAAPLSQEANAVDPPEIPHDQRTAPNRDPVASNENNAVANVSIDQPLVAYSPIASPAALPKDHSSLLNRSAETLKQKGRKRAGTPPLAAQRNKPSSNSQSSDAASEIIDPVRAALTWHDDEITVYDPEDKDDDGVGINGIGFKPTPAIAHARSMKKRQQLAEYKKREEREARARRSHRRRGSPERSAPPNLERKEAPRKVRFTEADPSVMIETI